MERILKLLDWLAARRGLAPSLPGHLVTGLAGEDAAFFYLKRKGYTVVARRWSTRTLRGDIDLIAWQGTLLCFVEVKTRTSHAVAPAEASVDAKKRRVLRKLASRYIRKLPRSQPPPIRFDVLSIYMVPGKETEFHHFEGAFGWSERSRYERY